MLGLNTFQVDESMSLASKHYKQVTTGERAISERLGMDRMLYSEYYYNEYAGECQYYSYDAKVYHAYYEA